MTIWRTRYREAGIAGLHNALKSGRPRSTGDEQIATLINTALKIRPSVETHWSRRSLAEATGLSTTTVHRYLTLSPRNASRPVTPEEVERFYHDALGLRARHSPHS